MPATKRNIGKGYVITIASIAATGGLLFGFDTGVISGAANFLQDSKGWNINDSQLEWATTSLLLGAMLGAGFCGRITDILGRKKIILATSVIFAIGAIITGGAPSIGIFITARIIIGMAIGVASFAVPLYISEISPTKIRGALVSMNQLMIAIGLKVSYISDYFIADDANPFCWRWMFYIGLFPALVLLVGMFFLPESPRWLISKGYEERGRKILKKLEEPDIVEESIGKIKADVARETESASYRELFKPWLRTALLISIGINFIQQATGINTIIYYAPKIFKIAGIHSNAMAILPSLLIGVVGISFTLISMTLIDKIGRRRLYFIGLSGMVISLIALGLAFFLETSIGNNLKYFALAAILIYNSFFAISLGPLCCLIVSELFPLKVRGAGMSIALLSNWFFNAIVAFTFLKLVNTFTPAGTFWIYAIVGIGAIIWCYYNIPETKGVTLEKIEDHWREGKGPREL